MKFQSVLVILSFFGANLSHAQERPCSALHLKSLESVQIRTRALINDFSRQPSHPVTKVLRQLAEQNLRLAFSLPANPGTPVTQHHKMVLAQIIAHQMHKLDHQSVSEIEKTVAAGRLFVSDHFNGYVESLGGTQFDLHMPKNFLGTPIEGLVMVHEREHLGQGAVLRRQIEKNPSIKSIPTVLGLRVSIERRFFNEMGAMAMEYHYLSSLTPEGRQWIVYELEKAPELISPGGSARAFYQILKSPFFSHPAASAHTYVYAQWKMGRYSYDVVEAEERIKRGLPVHD